MTEANRFVVVGSGSIARRHIANLKALYLDARVGCLSASGRVISVEETGADFISSDLSNAIAQASTFAVIASPAPFHLEQALEFLRAGVPVLIEKPLAISSCDVAPYRDALQAYSGRLDIAYNLRFMPSAQTVKALIEAQFLGRLHDVSIRVGQYLPDWRPGTDYRKNVSARAELGGGVLLELSHELDYLNWIFGAFERCTCISQHSGLLEIDVEDSVHALLERHDGVVAHLSMNFLQRIPVRQCIVTGEQGVLVWDLLANSVSSRTVAQGEVMHFHDPAYDRNQMYKDELLHFSGVANGTSLPAVGLEQAIDVLRLVDALKVSATQRKPIEIERA